MKEPAAAEGFKLAGKHRKECWGHEAGGFYSCDGHENRTKTGRRGGSTWWYRFPCNDPSCEAVALVRADVLAAFVNEGIAHVS